jgi:hypothetical protein
MELNPNIYPTVVFKLHPTVRSFLDGLDQAGQIDRDEHNAPHVVSVDNPDASIYKCVFIRNRKPESFVIHTRRKADPVRSWRDDDGYVRPERADVPLPGETSRKERVRREIVAFENIIEQILPRRQK